MNKKDRQFHITEGREVNNCVIYSWLMGYESDNGFFFYLDGPMEVLAYMGWPILEGQDI